MAILYVQVGIHFVSLIKGRTICLIWPCLHRNFAWLAVTRQTIRRTTHCSAQIVGKTTTKTTTCPDNFYCASSTFTISMHANAKLHASGSKIFCKGVSHPFCKLLQLSNIHVKP